MKRRVRGGRAKKQETQETGKTGPRGPELPVEEKAKDEAGYVIVPGMKVSVKPRTEGISRWRGIVQRVEWTEKHGWVVHVVELLTYNHRAAPADRCRVTETADDMANPQKRSRGVDLHRAILVNADGRLLRPTGKTRAELGKEAS